MPPQERLCTECGEPIGPKRLEALPHAQLCVDCAKLEAESATAIAPPKSIAAKPIATTTHHLKRYLVNVGQKTEPKALFGTLVRVHYLFPNISAAEMTPVFIDWSKRTHSPFSQEQLRTLILDAKQWVQDHPNRAR
jgi:hypothetical protein